MHIGVDESFVSKVVRRAKVLSPEKQEAWAEALGCSVQELFSATE